MQHNLLYILIYYTKNIFIITVLTNFALTYSAFTAYNDIETQKCFFVVVSITLMHLEQLHLLSQKY